jgi:hypothetical protein
VRLVLATKKYTWLKDYRDVGGCLLRSKRTGREDCYDDVNLDSHQLRGKAGEQIELSFRGSHLKIDVLPLGIAAFGQAFADLSPQRHGFCIAQKKYADTALPVSLLRSRGDGQAAAPLISAMNFRRLIAIPG